MSESDVSDIDEFEFESDAEELADAVETLLVADFTIATLQELKDSVLALTRRAADTVGLAPGTCLLLLNAFNWDFMAMASAYVEDRDEAARAVGLRQASEFALLDAVDPGSIDVQADRKRTDSTSNQKRKPREFVCPICLDVATTKFALGCKHYVCKPCFAQHVHINTIEERRPLTSTCPGNAKCSLAITREVVAKLVSPQTVDEYDLVVAQLYIDKLPRFRHCPHPGCKYIAETHAASAIEAGPQPTAEPVKCLCSHTFCFHCGLPTDHSAVPCTVATEWLALVDHEHRSTLWISQNTKQCPQCRTKIQRSEGCNHMSCGNCKYEFCWVCSQSWAEHSGKSYYNCVKFESSVSSSPASGASGTAITSKKQRERLNFYMLRYDNHSSLAELVEDAVAKDAHSLLAWAYVLLYCSVHTNNKMLLEELVTDLGRDVEDASPRLRQRTEALQKFVLTTKWTIDSNLALSTA